MILATHCLSAAAATKHDRRALLFTALVGFIVAASVKAAAAQQLIFEKYEVALSTAKRQTIVPGFFLGDPTAELAAVYIDENGERRVQLYEFDDDSRAPKIEARLRSGVLFVDVAHFDGRDRLITYEPGRLNWFDPASATERVLLKLSTSYRATDPGEVPHIDVTRDLNGDGRGDIVLPDTDGFWIAIQMTNGSFSEASKIGPPEPFARYPVGNLDLDLPASIDVRTYGDVGISAVTAPWYLSRVHQFDYDRDGRIDLVFRDDDHFDVYLQIEGGLFDPVAESFTVDVPIDSDGVYSSMFDFSDQGVLSAVFGFGDKTERTVLHSIRDLNGDRLADLVTLTLTGRSITRQRSIYEVRFGSSTPDGLLFARNADTAIIPRGKAGAMQPWGYSVQRFEDLDADGRVDIMFRDVAVGFGGMIRALLGNSVPINIEFYQMQHGVYPDQPTTTVKVSRFDPVDGLGNVFLPAVLLGDVSGDGRSDLLIGHSPEELHIYSGASEPGLFARQPRQVEIDLPYDERNIRLADLNNDDKQDVLIYHLSRNGSPLVIVLIAR